jgi:hypothetical protein
MTMLSYLVKINLFSRNRTILAVFIKGLSNVKSYLVEMYEDSRTQLKELPPTKKEPTKKEDRSARRPRGIKTRTLWRRMHPKRGKE